MLHYAHQLVAIYVYWLFGAETFLEIFCFKTLPSVAENNTMRVVKVNQNYEVVGCKTKTGTELRIDTRLNI